MYLLLERINLKFNKSKLYFYLGDNLFLKVAVFLFISFSSLISEESNQSRSSIQHENHSQSVAWQNINKPPSISLEVNPALDNGWTISSSVKNFSFSPEKTGEKHAIGEGHMHLYINNKKTARLYGFPHYINNLKKGDEVKVTLNSNDHRYYELEGNRVEKKIIITQLINDSNNSFQLNNNKPTNSDLNLNLKKDPINGWNLSINNGNLKLCQINKNQYTKNDLSKFLKLYINNEFKTLIYGKFHHIPELPSGSNIITVILRSELLSTQNNENDELISDSILHFNANIDSDKGKITFN